MRCKYGLGHPWTAVTILKSCSCRQRLKKTQQNKPQNGNLENSGLGSFLLTHTTDPGADQSTTTGSKCRTNYPGETSAFMAVQRQHFDEGMFRDGNNQFNIVIPVLFCLDEEKEANTLLFFFQPIQPHSSPDVSPSTDIFLMCVWCNNSCFSFHEVLGSEE